ncbi:MAG: rod shape-determining protein MreC, partial [Planctomycetota bacterium]
MSQRRAWGLFAALVLTSLALITFDFRDDEAGPTAAGRAVATSGFEPFESALSAALRPLRGFGDGAVDLFATRSENQRLRAENEVLEARRRVFADLEREVAELRALLGFREEHGLATV